LLRSLNRTDKGGKVQLLSICIQSVYYQVNRQFIAGRLIWKLLI